LLILLLMLHYLLRSSSLFWWRYYSIGWDNILPGYGNYPTSFKRNIPYLLSSIAYYQDSIRSNLSLHPLLNHTFNVVINGEQKRINIMVYFKIRFWQVKQDVRRLVCKLLEYRIIW
jgi:hypothetical protein